MPGFLVVDLLAGHQVEAIVKDGLVYLPHLDRWANLWMNQIDGGSYLIEIRATAANDVTIADRCAAVGATFESAREDGLRSFCSGTFHVLLAALWGVLELDQVDHEVRVVRHRTWDIYTGPCIAQEQCRGGTARAAARARGARTQTA